MVPDAINLASVRRVLVTKLRHHGDVLLASPVFTVLANRAWIDISQFEHFDVLDAAPGEPWAANTMLVNGTVLMPSCTSVRPISSLIGSNTEKTACRSA